MKKITWIALLALGFLATSMLTGCGGGMSAPPPLPISASVSPSTASVQVSQTASFMATVQNDSANKGVTWSLSGAGCSAAACGALSAGSSASGASITYTAPASVPTPATVTLTASSVADTSKSAAATITIAPAPLSIFTPSLPDGVVGTPYHQAVQATGGVAPFTWIVSAGALPSGLKSDNSTSNTLTISGTPDMVQMMVQFAITVTDSANQSAMHSYTVNINNPAVLTIGTTSVPPGTVNVAYSFTFSAAGGSPPYTWSENGALPAGLTFATNGTLSGTPTAVGTFPIMVTVKDNALVTVTKQFNVVVYLASSVLNGQYVFQFQGFNSSGAFAAVGSFVADGFGTISAATVDTNGVGGPQATNLALSGTYSFDANNLGTMTLTGLQGNATFRFALYPNPTGSNISSGGSIIEFDSVKSGTGSISTQDPTAFSASKITGGYVFSFTGGSASGRAAVAGRLTADGVGLGGPNSLSSGAMDVNESGVVSNVMFTGIYNVPASSTNGRGTATLNTTLGGNPVAFNFTFYIQDATALLFLGSDAVSAALPLLSGSMIPQAPLMYTNGTLSGTSVLATAGLASAGPDITGGLFTVTPSSGNYGFTYDENSGGTIASNKQVTGTYTVDSSGRVTVTGVGVTHPPVLYLSGLNSGFMLGTDANVSSGTLIALAPPTTLQGSLAVKTGAPGTANQENDFGTLTFSNNSVSGSVNIGSPSGFHVKVPVMGTYSIDPGGDRGTITITSGLHLGTSRFYLTGNSRFVFLNSINPTDTLPLLFTGGCIQYVGGPRGGQTCK